MYILFKSNILAGLAQKVYVSIADFKIPGKVAIVTSNMERINC